MSKLWYIVMGIVVALCLASASMFRSQLHHQQTQSSIDDLLRDRMELEQILKLDARDRLDAILPIASEPGILRALRSQVGASKAADSATHSRFGAQLASLNSALKEQNADLLMLLDSEGREFATTDSTARQFVPSFSKMPIIANALSGFAVDGVWVLGGKPHQVVAVPISDYTKTIGAIVHAKKIDDQLASRVSKRLEGATIAFTMNNEIVSTGAASSAKVVDGNTLGELLKKSTEPGTVNESGVTDVLANGNEIGIYSRLAGSDAASAISHIIARTKPTLASGMFGSPSAEDVKGIHPLADRRVRTVTDGGGRHPSHSLHARRAAETPSLAASRSDRATCNGFGFVETPRKLPRAWRIDQHALAPSADRQTRSFIENERGRHARNRRAHARKREACNAVLRVCGKRRGPVDAERLETESGSRPGCGVCRASSASQRPKHRSNGR
ncbi:MAG: hypothetical protein R3A47_02995 [Polyangiales bacterium]